MKETVKDFGVLLAYALIALFPYVKKGLKDFIKKKSDYLSKNLKIRRQIDDIVNELKIYLEANRCLLIEFSNTEKSTGGFPFEFVNVSCEKTDGNVVSIKDQIRKVPIGNMLDWFLPIAEKERYHFFQNPDSRNTEEIRNRMHELALSTIIYIKISDYIKDGVIVLHFNQPYLENWKVSEKTVLSEDLQYVKFQVARIFALMKTLKK